MTADAFYVFRSEEAASRMEAQWEDRGQGSGEAIYVSTYGNERDRHGTTEIKYEQDRVAEWFAGPIPDYVLDLIEIALATFAVDKTVDREITISDDDKNARINTRNIRLGIPVLSDRLSVQSAEGLLSTTISRTSRDLFEIKTHQPPSVRTVAVEDREPVSTAISLFSGGLDSTGGVFYNRERDIDARYVSLNYGRGLNPLLKAVSDKAGICPNIVGITYLGSQDESTQFTRGFLHLAFGVAAAVGRGAPTVQCFENGLVARFNILRDAWMTTRTVEPEFLAAFNHFLSETMPTTVRVRNPFNTWTKSEAIDEIPDVDTVLATISCPHSHKFDFADLDNCGLCVPCLIRTISILASGHPVDRAELNVFDAFGQVDFENMEFTPELELPMHVRTNERAVSQHVFLRAVAEISYFCRQLLNGREEQLARECPELHDPQVLELHRTFAEEFEAAIGRISKSNPTAEYLLRPDSSRQKF